MVHRCRATTGCEVCECNSKMALKKLDVLMGASGVIFVIFDLVLTHARDFDSVLKCIFEGCSRDVGDDAGM